MTSETYSSLELEIFALAAAWDAIGSMVNFEHIEPFVVPDGPFLRFKSSANGKLFLIMLADFLSYPKDGTLGLTRRHETGSLGWTQLGYLEHVCSNPEFAGETKQLNKSVLEFSEWLDGEFVVEKVWFPSIDYSGDLKVRRLSFLKICGMATKHGFTRLSKTVKDIQSIMEANGRPIDEGQGFLVLENFREWFRDDIFIGSATRISWHLNEIRWGIYGYLKQEFDRAYVSNPSKEIYYSYDEPECLSSTLSRSIYWDLMNEIRSEPYFPRFDLHPYLAQLN